MCKWLWLQRNARFTPWPQQLCIKNNGPPYDMHQIVWPSLLCLPEKQWPSPCLHQPPPSSNLWPVPKLLFLLSFVLGSVFLDAIGLVGYEDQISSLDTVSLNGVLRNVKEPFYHSKYHLRGIVLKNVHIHWSVGFSLEVSLFIREDQFVTRCFIRFKN